MRRGGGGMSHVVEVVPQGACSGICVWDVRKEDELDIRDVAAAVFPI